MQATISMPRTYVFNLTSWPHERWRHYSIVGDMLISSPAPTEGASPTVRHCARGQGSKHLIRENIYTSQASQACGFFGKGGVGVGQFVKETGIFVCRISWLTCQSALKESKLHTTRKQIEPEISISHVRESKITEVCARIPRISGHLVANATVCLPRNGDTVMQ